jgi:hypothetical protein
MYWLGHAPHAGADNYLCFVGRGVGSGDENCCYKRGSSCRDFEAKMPQGDALKWTSDLQDKTGCVSAPTKWSSPGAGTYELWLVKASEPEGDWHKWCQISLDKIVLSKSQSMPSGAGPAATYEGGSATAVSPAAVASVKKNGLWISTTAEGTMVVNAAPGTELVAYDLRGAVIWRHRTTEGTTSLGLGNLPSGCHVVAAHRDGVQVGAFKTMGPGGR